MATPPSISGENLRKAAAPPTPWTPTGGRAVQVAPIPDVSPAKFMLRVKFLSRASSRKANQKTITSLHADYPGAPGFLGCYHQKQWTTRKAAEAAIPHFRKWVDEGRRKQTAAGAAGRARSATEAAAAATADELPVRYSKRRNLGTVVKTAMSCVGSAVMLVLATAAAPLDVAVYNAAWAARSSALRRAVSKRRGAQTFDVSAALGSAIADVPQGPLWHEQTVGLRVALRSTRPRGAGRGQMVSVHSRRGKRARPDLHVARPAGAAACQG